MTKIDIYSGVLGAGKTTLIKKLVAEAYKGQKIVIIENEFGEIGIDGGFLKEAGVEIREMNSGCICCSLTGDFKEALKLVLADYHPDRIIIEPSGVGKLSEVAAAVMAAGADNFELGGLTTVVDAGKCKMYLKNFGEFFTDQVATAHCIILSRTGKLSPEKVEEAVALLREQAPDAVIMTADWSELDGKEMLAAIDGRDSISEQLEELIKEHLAEEAEEDDDDDDEHEHEHHHHHHHHHDEDDDDDDDEDEEEHEHHHHHHGHECHHHHHHHHHDGEHDADEVFTSWGEETAKHFTEEEIAACLEALNDTERFGFVLRAKGIVAAKDGGWIHFDFTPGEADVRRGAAAPTGILCVIGAELKEDEVENLFGV